MIDGLITTSTPKPRKNARKTRIEQEKYKRSIIQMMKPTMRNILCGDPDTTDEEDSDMKEMDDDFANDSQMNDDLNDDNSNDDANKKSRTSHFVHKLSEFFCTEPRLLKDVVEHTVEEKPKMRNVLFNAMFDVPKLEQACLQQMVALKHGGKIPDRRWKLKFSPIFQNAVW